MTMTTNKMESPAKAATAMTLKEAAKALKDKLSTLKEVWDIRIGEDSLLVYTTTAKVWVDLPPIFPKGPEGYNVHMVVSRPRRPSDVARPARK